VKKIDTSSLKQWVLEEIQKRGFNGICGIASFSDVYSNLMPIQQEEVKKVCDIFFNSLLNKGSIISMAIFHTEHAIRSINVHAGEKVDYERWNFYADEYNRLNNALNDVCTKLTSILDGVPLRATSELGKKVRLVEEYYPFAKISHRVVAEHAGIGFKGKHELIVTRQNGPALRLNSFITPIKLEKDEKIENLCDNCKACLDSCKILQRKTELKNYRQQCMEKINAMNLRHSVCGICLRACYDNGFWRR
jgi:hypothetical protein